MQFSAQRTLLTSDQNPNSGLEFNSVLWTNACQIPDHKVSRLPFNWSSLLWIYYVFFTCKYIDIIDHRMAADFTLNQETANIWSADFLGNLQLPAIWRMVSENKKWQTFPGSKFFVKTACKTTTNFIGNVQVNHIKNEQEKYLTEPLTSRLIVLITLSKCIQLTWQFESELFWYPFLMLFLFV